MGKNKLYILIYFVISLFTLGWFRGEQIIYGGDSTWPLDLKLYFEQSRHLWFDNISPSFVGARNLANSFPLGGYGALLDLVGFSPGMFQRLVYVISFFISGYGAYLLVKKLGAEEFYAFISGLFYMLSPFALVVAWNPTYGKTFPFYTFLPLACFLFLYYLESARGYINKELVISTLIVALSFMGMSYANPVFFILYLVILGFLFIYKILGSKKEHLKLLSLKFLIYFFVTLLLNSFWLLPFLSNLSSEFVRADNVVGGLIDDAETRTLNSVSIVDAYRMSGLWTMFGGHKYEPYYPFYKYWFSNTYALTSFVVVVVALFALLLKRSKQVTFLLLLFLGAVVLNSGLRWPFANSLVQKLYSIGYFGRAFRSVYLKLGYLLVLPICALLGISLTNMKEKYRKTFVVLIFLAIFINGLPFFSGEIIKPHGKRLPGYSVSIPEEYETLAEYLAQDTSFTRVLSLPVPKTYNYSMWWKDYGLTGVYFFHLMVDKPIVFMGVHPYIHDFSADLDTDVLRTLGIKYVLWHKDVPLEDYPFYLTNSPQSIQQLLAGDKFTSVLETSLYSLYKFEDPDMLPLFYVFTEEGIVIPVEYTRHSPVEYDIDLPEIPPPYKLVFNDTYNKGWWLYSEEGGVSADLHKGFANSWKISSKDKDGVLLKFKPHNTAVLGVITSVSTAVLLAGLGIYLSRKDRRVK